MAAKTCKSCSGKRYIRVKHPTEGVKVIKCPWCKGTGKA